MSKFACWALAALFVSNLCLVLKNLGGIMAVSMTYHFLGGFFAAMLLASFYNSEFSKLSQPTRFLVVVAMALAVGAFWEMAEYLASQILTEPIYQAYQYHLYFIGDLADTIQDLLMDTLGAIAFVFLARFKSGKNS